MVALLGRNGAGKSTTLKTIMGIVPVRTGRTRFDGADITGLATHRVARLGIAYVPEDRGIFASLSVQEHLTLANVRGGWPLARIYEAFPRLAERRDHRGTQLSGGEQQMLSIARALTLAPRLLIMDEPTEGLAPVIVEEIAAIIERLKAQGLTMLLVEQNYPFAAAHRGSRLRARQGSHPVGGRAGGVGRGRGDQAHVAGDLNRPRLRPPSSSSRSRNHWTGDISCRFLDSSRRRDDRPPPARRSTPAPQGTLMARIASLPAGHRTRR